MKRYQEFDYSSYSNESYFVRDLEDHYGSTGNGELIFESVKPPEKKEVKEKSWLDIQMELAGELPFRRRSSHE